MEYHSDKPVLGFRRYKIRPPFFGQNEHSLYGAWSLKPWPTDGPLFAECLSTRYPSCKEKGPLRQAEMCRCGIHLYYSYGDAKDRTDTCGEGGYVIALCAAGGRILFDEIHCRASVMQLIALIDPRQYPQSRKVGIGANRHEEDRTENIVTWTKATAKRYRVPIMSVYDATEFGLELGGAFVDGVHDTLDGQEIVEGVDNSGRAETQASARKACSPPSCSQDDPEA